MKLTTKGHFAVTAMLDLALNATEHPVSLAAISKRQHISQSYLEQLFIKLRKNGLVESTRGPGGGYTLGRSSDAISIGAIIESVEDLTDATRCLGQANCKNGSPCLTHDLWMHFNHSITMYLSMISLDDVLHKRFPALTTTSSISALTLTPSCDD